MSEDSAEDVDQSKDEKFNHKKLQRHADAIDHEMSRGDAPGETSLALPVVANCRRKITALLQEWPEHPLVSVNLAEICDRILKLPLLGPVKTFLTGLERFSLERKRGNNRHRQKRLYLMSSRLWQTWLCVGDDVSYTRGRDC